MLDAGMEYQIAAAVSIRFPNDAGDNEVWYRRWTGEGTLTHDGADYASGGIVDVGDIELGGGLTDATSIKLAVITDRERFLFLGIDPNTKELIAAADPGPAPVTVYDLWRKRSTGSDWPAWTVTESYSGKLSDPQYSDGGITFDVQRVFDDVWRGGAAALDRHRTKSAGSPATQGWTERIGSDDQAC